MGGSGIGEGEEEPDAERQEDGRAGRESRQDQLRVLSCGTGTSARLANLHARGQLGVGGAFGHESIIGTLFTGRIAALTDVAGTPAVVPEITGRAWMTGQGTLCLDSTDPFPGGFLL